MIGVGINLVAPVGGFPDDFPHPAAALLAAPDAAIAESVINGFLTRLRALIAGGILPPEYKKNCCTLGRKVTLRRGEQIYVGTALDVDPSGALLVQTDKGILTFTSGEVTSQI